MPSHLSSSTNIQAHLYEAFLSHETCDVSLICVGAGHGGRSPSQWTASYESHRVILIQAAYFKSLFTSGFVESGRSSPHANAKKDTPGSGASSLCAQLDVRLQFDDPNITRAAFELCLARLYGGGPLLHLPEDLRSTASHPLTSSFPLPPPSLFPSFSSTRSIPAGHHPATPRFLLSLLATATYLAMPSVASEALQLIMRSVGPWTVVRYLRFAIGEGIGLDTDDDDYNDDIRSAVGLEHVAHDHLLDAELDPMGTTTVTRSFDPLRAPSIRSHRSATSKLTATILLRSSGRGGDSSGVRDSDFEVIEKSQGMSSDEDDPLGTPGLHEHEGNDDLEDEDIPRYFYGAVGNRIGEACACWLARWGGDILDYEEAIFALRKGEGEHGHTSSASTSSSVGACPANIDPLSTVAWKALAGLHSATSSTGKSTSFFGPRRSDIVVWGNGGLSVRWVRGVISSDAFFVADENERYNFAVRVHRLRQAMREANYGNLPNLTLREQEIGNREWEELFRTGIYYSHMSFHDLIELESDGFVAPETLTFAHWTHSVFRNSIVSARPPYHQPHAPTCLSSSISALSLGASISSTVIGTSRTPTSPAQPRALGLTRTTAEIKASLEDNNPMRAAQAARKTYFPVLGDGSARLGDYHSNSTAELPDHLNSPLFPTADGMGAHGSMPRNGKPVATARKPLDEMDFFGLGNARRTAPTIPREDPSGTAKWTEFEPFRFSTEWWDADTLKEKARLYSVTRPYAGSLFNVYIQVVRKRGLQLGLYLHRQSLVDPVPVASSAPGSRERSTSGAGSMLRLSPSSNLSLRTLDAHGPSEVPMQISTRTSQLTGAVSSSPPTPTSALTQLPNIPRVGSPGASSVAGAGGIAGITASSTFPGAAGLPHSTISTTYTTYFRSASPAIAESYRDPRASVRAYFSIACPSASGTSMTTFKSAPDYFAIDGSWGWRSSACVEIPTPPKEPPEDENTRANAGPPKDRDSAAVRQWLRELTSVRAAIVIGVV